MEYITRQEKYLAYLAQLKTGTLPAPQTREETYLAAIAGLYKKPLPYPQTRVEMYLKAIADGKSTGLPEPRTRKEYYLYAIATDDTQRYIPTPITREEQLLDKVVNILVGVEDVTVSGSGSVMLYNAANHGFTGMTLYGKSTQVSTPGAQLLDTSKLRESNCTMKIEEQGRKIKITGRGAYSGARIHTDDIGMFSDGIGKQVFISVKTTVLSGKAKVLIALPYILDGAISYIAVNGSGFYTHIIPDGATLGTFLINVNHRNEVLDEDVTVVFEDLIVGIGSTALPFEPYTGGKPSPSPEYPQEIESAGRDGEIGVTVTGANLLPFEVGQKGDGFEVFADGVQIDVGSRTTILAVGQIQDSTESGYDEFALMTAGKYYIYSDIPDVKLYVVVWRKGTRVTLGYSAAGVAKEIEVMDGDKFRILLRAEDAFKGKVKAMITRIPVNATSYEPYKPAQTLIIPTPNGLPGIPVSSRGNYTDKDGQQWVCDEVDFKKGVYVQRVAKEIPKTSFTISETVDVEGRYKFDGAFKNIYKIGGKACLISHGIYLNYALKKNTWAISLSSFYYSPAERTTVDKIKEKILSLINSDNPLTFLGQLETPIEIPLTTEQLAKYKALRTYSPTTTVINDAGADMKITYRCNLKKTESELEALYVDTEREFKAIAETEDEK